MQREIAALLRGRFLPVLIHESQWYTLVTHVGLESDCLLKSLALPLGTCGLGQVT